MKNRSIIIKRARLALGALGFSLAITPLLAGLAGATTLPVRGPVIRPLPCSVVWCSGWTYSNMDFAGESISGVNLSGDTFVNDNFTGANFIGSNLSGTKFQSDNLNWAVLTGVNLTDANLSGANLTNVSSGNVQGSASIVLPPNWETVHGYLLGPEADLGYADLQGADLYTADLQGADLLGANLEGTDNYWVNLSYANLTYANLSGADDYYMANTSDTIWYDTTCPNGASSGVNGICALPTYG